jgi:hypothetical protein
VAADDGGVHTFSTFPDVLRDRVQGRVIHWISLVPLYCSEMLIQKGGFTLARYGALELGLTISTVLAKLGDFVLTVPLHLPSP